MKMSSGFRIALVQLEILSGRAKENVARMISHMEALHEEVDLIAFPEMAVGGYLLGDLWTSEDWCDHLESFNETIREASATFQTSVAFGNIYVDRSGRPNKDGRRRKYNAAYLFQNGHPVASGAPHFPAGVQAKTLLPNYRFFDDERFFYSLQDAAQDFGVEIESLTKPFVLGPHLERGTAGIRVGLQLCEDLWCQDYWKNGEPINTAAALTRQGAEVLINLSASPWTWGKNAARDRKVKGILSGCTRPVPYLYVNRIGAENCGDNVIVYDGGSTVYDSQGEPLLLANHPFKEEILKIEITPDGKVSSNHSLLTPTPRIEESKIAQKNKAVVQGLHHLSHLTGQPQPKVLVGLSGGVDSAVAAALVVQAFGPESLILVTMPGRFTSPATLANAETTAKSLGVTLHRVPIDSLVEAARGLIDEIPGPVNSGTLPHENEQARIRGSVILSGIAARLGVLYTCNGNKLETALGYATLYGDVNGAIAPLADLTKVEVMAMAQFLNDEIFKREVIPSNLIPNALWQFPSNGVLPSAELRADQIDPMKFGYHDALLEAFLEFRKASPEKILEWFLEGVLAERLGIAPELIERWGVHQPQVFVEDLEWFVRQFYNSVFKRIQAPPIIITSKTAFGYDLRESIGVFQHSARYQELKEKVLSSKFK